MRESVKDSRTSVFLLTDKKLVYFNVVKLTKSLSNKQLIDIYPKVF